MKYLKNKGYKTVHFKSGWMATDYNANADYNLGQKDFFDDFSITFLQTTLLNPFIGKILKTGYRENILNTFDKLANIDDIKEPKFVFAHIVSPHPPYAFDEYGNANDFSKLDNDWSNDSKKEYIGQLKFTNYKTKILIVDDHPAIRKTMVDVLTEEGFATDVAKDGSDALSKLLSQLYDFVLIDVQMPKINGVEVLRELKQKKDSLPKFIFFSAYSLPELKEEAVQLGCLAFLEKPIELKEIISLIKDNKSTALLIYLKDINQGKLLTKTLKEDSFHVILAENIDQTLIQLRQINFRILIFDSDLPGAEQESINATIKSLRSNTLTVETNEDEKMDVVLGKVDEKIKQYKLNHSQ